MSPAPATQQASATASPSPPQQAPPPQRPAHVPSFDDIFHRKFMEIIQRWKDDPRSAQLTSRDRKDFIDSAYTDTDMEVFGRRPLSDQEIKLRALTKVFYKVLSEEPWSEEWIRPHDVERKLSRFEMSQSTAKLAAQHGLYTVKDCVVAALKELRNQKTAPKDKDDNPDKTNLRGPWDDIEIIYIPGTVSSTATNKIDRPNIYPVSVASVANIMHNHICRDMTRPFAMAQKFVTVTDTEELMKMRQFACDVCDFAPHLLDNDNISLLVVLLILTRSEVCRRFENNGIRIEGSTVSHRRAECMKQKLGWRSTEERKPFDNVAIELQTRVKNACFPAPRLTTSRIARPPRKSATPGTPGTPPIGYWPMPVPRTVVPTLASQGIALPHKANGTVSPYAANHGFPHPPSPWSNGAGSSNGARPSSRKGSSNGAGPSNVAGPSNGAGSPNVAGPSNGAGSSNGAGPSNGAATAPTPPQTGPGSSAAEPMDID